MDALDYKYELLTIEWNDSSEEEGISSIPEFVRDGNSVNYQSQNSTIESDDIPQGQSLEDIRAREKVISQFFHTWSETHPDRTVLNEKLKELIYIKGKSIAEMMQHSSKRYFSTLAVLHFEEILRGAEPVSDVPIKKGNGKQEEFDHLLVLSYKHPEYGFIKVTVGVKKSNGQKIQYGMTTLRQGQQIIDPAIAENSKCHNKKKASHKK